MKKGKELTKTESRRRCIALLCAAVLIGIAVGAAAAASGAVDITGERVMLHQYFAPEYSGDTALEVFGNTFGFSAIYLLLIFLLGFFPLGQPLGAASLIYRGFGIGASTACLYGHSGFGALPSVLLLILPKAIVLSYIGALAVREQLKLSNLQYNFLFREKLPEEHNIRTIKLYCIKFAVLILLAALTAAGDSLMNYLFMKMN